MKKMLLLATLIAFCTPVFADGKKGNDGAKNVKKAHQEATVKKDTAKKVPARKGPAAKKGERRQDPALKAHEEAMDKYEDKLEQLVKQYKATKQGSIEQTKKRQEISKELEAVRAEQISMRETKIKQFEDRLATMKKDLDEEKDPKAQEEWVKNVTQKVIASDGDLEDVLDREGRVKRRYKDGKGPRGHAKGPKGAKLPFPTDMSKNKAAKK